MSPGASSTAAGQLVGTASTPAQQAPPASYAAVIIASSAALAASVRAILLDAVVRTRAPGGIVTLEVDSGVVTIKTAAPLAIGAAVRLEVSRSDDQLIARISAAPPVGLRSAAQPASSDDAIVNPVGRPLPLQEIAPRTAPITTTAVILTPPSTAASAPASAFDTIAAAVTANPVPTSVHNNAVLASASGALPTGVSPATSSLTPTTQSAAAASADIASTLPRVAASPVIAGGVAITLGPSAASAQGMPMVAFGGSEAAQPTPTPLTPGTTLGVRIIPPDEVKTTAPAAMKGLKLPAIVAGALPQDRLIVDTPLGRIAVSVPPDFSDAAPGTSLPLEWFPETIKLPLAEHNIAASATTSRNWPLTRLVAQALLDAHDPTLQQASDALIPKPGPKLAQQLMEFIGHGDGDLNRWLGDALARQLETLGMLDRNARAESAGGRTSQRQNADGEWRHVTVPLFDGQMLRPLEIYARRRRDARDDHARSQNRFVVECAHDEFGAIQIDGLMTAGSGKRRLDVIMRSNAEMPPDDRAAINTLFADACGAMGLSGEIAFQTLRHFPVIAPELTLARRDVVA